MILSDPPRRLSPLALTLLAFGATAALAQDSTSIFPVPTGPYPTGFTEYLWIDEDRREPFTADPDDRRHVIVRIWYPAAAARTTDRASYVADTTEFGASAALFGPASRMKTHSARDVALAPGSARFPVLTFSHGFGWPRFTSSFVTEWLASYGYVVIGINHTGSNQTMQFPNGYQFTADATLPPEPTGDGERDARAFWQHLTDNHLPLWQQDISFVLDQAERLDAGDGPFHGRLDLGRVGAFGWSFGGAMSLDVTRVDRRVRAAVDLDGQLFGDVIETGTDRPVMLMHSTLIAPQGGEVTQEVLDRLIAEVRGNTESFLQHSRGDWYDLRINGTQHGSFSDLVLFTDERMPGELNPKRAHEIIQVYTLAFFDRYLRGRDSPLLLGPAAEHPEVEWRARGNGPMR